MVGQTNVVTQDDTDNYLKGHKEPAYPQIAHWQLATGHWPLATDQTSRQTNAKGLARGKLPGMKVVGHHPSPHVRGLVVHS